MNELTSFQFRISSLVPQKPIYCGKTVATINTSEVYAESLKEFHAFGSVTTLTTITDTNYVADATVDYQNGTAFGIELESFANKSDILQSGTNTLGSNICLDLTYIAQPDDVTVNIFALFDVMLNINNGIMTATFQKLKI